MTGTAYLGGGGSDRDEALLWDELFEPGQRGVLWPYALRSAQRRQQAAAWWRDVLASRGVADVWLEDPDDAASELEGSDVLLLPGGNTFDLLDAMHRHDRLERVLRFLSRGGRVYGGSAGAV